MLKLSASKLRNNFFTYLDKVSEGEIIIVHRNNKEVARIIPKSQGNWRRKNKIKAKLLVSPEELIKPIQDIWEDYL